ncbi:MAG TPA: hypothetical protein VEL07_03035 [Planctomycetota bacterium]|nr:hypothetical protein [Planctomycetota bacterium]
MHTTRDIRPSHLRCVHGGESADVAQVLPRLGIASRLAIVSPRGEDAILDGGYAIAAAVAAFYAVRPRPRSHACDYPAFVLLTNDPIDDALATAWANLDVWPAERWIRVAPGRDAVIEAIVHQDATHVLWPESLAGAPDIPGLRYGGRNDSGDVLIEADAPVERMIRVSLDALPASAAIAARRSRAPMEAYGRLG